MALVAFDMDGVLVDSERFWPEREREDMFPACVAGDVDPAAVTGMNVENLYDHLDAEYGTTVGKAASVERYDRVATHIYDERVSLLEGFERPVGLLHERGVEVALVSSSPKRWIDRFLDRFLFHEVFDAVVSAEHVERVKPAPDVYLHAVSLLDRDPVEDSANGLRAAASVGYTTVGYLNGTNERADLADADSAAEGLEALSRAVLDWLP